MSSGFKLPKLGQDFNHNINLNKSVLHFEEIVEVEKYNKHYRLNRLFECFKDFHETLRNSKGAIKEKEIIALRSIKGTINELLELMIDDIDAKINAKYFIKEVLSNE